MVQCDDFAAAAAAHSRRPSHPFIAPRPSPFLSFSSLLTHASQACFYIPWALLQCDDFTAAVAARKAYVDYIDHVHALAAIALKAADGVSGAGEGRWCQVQVRGRGDTAVMGSCLLGHHLLV
jgi:hypothetical protein